MGIVWGEMLVDMCSGYDLWHPG